MRDREGRLLLPNDFEHVVVRAEAIRYRGRKARRRAANMLFEMYEFLKGHDLPEKDRLAAAASYNLRRGEYTEAHAVFQNIYRVHFLTRDGQKINPAKLLDKLFPEPTLGQV